MWLLEIYEYGCWKKISTKDIFQGHYSKLHPAPLHNFATAPKLKLETPFSFKPRSRNLAGATSLRLSWVKRMSPNKMLFGEMVPLISGWSVWPRTPQVLICALCFPPSSSLPQPPSPQFRLSWGFTFCSLSFKNKTFLASTMILSYNESTFPNYTYFPEDSDLSLSLLHSPWALLVW